MDIDLAQAAINAALAGDWQKALQTNQAILKEKKDDVDALNRLARAHAELGDIQKARECLKKVLSIDTFNTIAQKSLERWKDMKNGDIAASSKTSAQVFLEEPGKTKIVPLMHLGGPEIIAEIDAGDEVKLNCNSHKVAVLTHTSKNIGKLPDDLSARLRKLTSVGYEYKVFVKSVDKNEIRVLIRETKRPPKLSDIPSFPAERLNYISFTPPELVSREEYIASTDEETQEDEA